jgi:hypothetical protein
VTVIIAIGVNTDGRREFLGLEIGTSKGEPIWTEFLRELTRRGLRGVNWSSPTRTKASRRPSPGAQRHLATVPGTFHAQCAGSCREPAPI